MTPDIEVDLSRIDRCVTVEIDKVRGDVYLSAGARVTVGDSTGRFPARVVHAADGWVTVAIDITHFQPATDREGGEGGHDGPGTTVTAMHGFVEVCADAGLPVARLGAVLATHVPGRARLHEGTVLLFRLQPNPSRMEACPP